MSAELFEPGFDSLPEALPIFPLTGVLLLPGGKLPLNIFEPRYLAMTRDALAGTRLIGMVQPNPAADSPQPSDGGAAEVYKTGCAGRITAFNETEDGRYLISLSGLIRFDIAEELPMVSGYRRVRPDWSRFSGDLNDVEGAEAAIDRDRLLDALRAYFDAEGLSGDWDAISQSPDERLVTSLAMICPFGGPEKQALLEAPDLAERARTITAILEMAALDGGEGAASRH